MPPKKTAKTAEPETPKNTRAKMSQSHKDALAKGRDHGRAVKNYLEALEANKPKRGRKRTPEGMKKRLARIEEELATASALKKLQLTQERMNLRAELATYGTKKDISDAEDAFVEVAAAYSQAKGISFRAWRAQGVSAEILDRAGVPREPA